jgi:hypothetical protein
VLCKLTFWSTIIFREMQNSLFKNHLVHFELICLFNVSNKCTYNTWYYFTSVWHVSARQCYLRGVHTKMKIIYSELDYIYEFHIFQYILLLITAIMWLKYLHFRMFCYHNMCHIITHVNTKHIKYNYRWDCNLWQCIFKHLL